MADYHADADTALGIPLRNGIDDDHVVLDPLEVECRKIRGISIAELPVNLVGEQEQVVDDGGEGSAEGAGPEADDKDAVQDDVESRSNGDEYEGGVVNGLIEGRGTYTWKKEMM